MSAPYWGKLPAPKTAVPSRQHRYSGDYSAALDQPDDQPRQQPHRISVQTTNTEDPADSSFSPFASPTASSFTGNGLAPRPPSYQLDATDYPPDIADRRAHRRSHRHDDSRDLEFDAATPPAVPEVPRAPPLSYRAGRFSNSSTPDAYAAAAAAVAASRSSGTPATPPVVTMDRVRGQQYTSPRDEPRDYFSADPGHAADPVVSPRARVAGEIPLQQVRKGSVREVTTPGRGGSEADQPQPRRASAASQAGGRSRKFADDRSPLQKLELTLDSITKEEKRAKVEAAERRARERAARAAEAAKGTPPGGQQQQQHQQRQQQQQQQHSPARFRERGASQADIEEDLPTPTRRPSARAPEQSVAAHRGPLSQNPPQESSRHHEVPPPRALPVPPGPPVEPITPATVPAQAPGPDYSPEEPPAQTSGGNMGLPRRNLSFRERAAQRQDFSPPNGVESGSPAAAPVAAPAGRPQSSGSFSLSRSNSNKLRKDPPGDPWYRLRVEAQNAMRENPQPQPELQPHPQSQPQPRPLPQPQSQPQPRPLPQPQSQPQPQPRPLPQPQLSDPRNGYSGREPPPRTKPQQSHHDESLLAPAPEVRRAHPGAHPETHPEALTPGIRRNATEPIPSTTQTTVTFDDEPTILQGPAREDGSVMSDQDHRDFTPGDGLYLPPKFLDEWRQATVGSLGGPMLNLREKSAPPVADPSRAWWEDGPRTKSMSSRPRKAEAFDGEYSETNGMCYA